MKEMVFLTLEQVAKTLQIHKMTVYREIKRGQLKAAKFGKEFRILNSDFQSYLRKAYLAAAQSNHIHTSCVATKPRKKAKTAQQKASKRAVRTAKKTSKKTVNKKTVVHRKKSNKIR